MSRVSVDDKVFGARLKQIRQKSGLTVNQVAKYLGMSYQQIHKYELGENRVSIGTLVKLAHFFKLPMATFLQDFTDVDDFNKLSLKERTLATNLLKTAQGK